MTGTTIFSLVCAITTVILMWARILYLAEGSSDLEQIVIAAKQTTLEVSYTLLVLLILKYLYFLLLQPV